MSGERNTVFSHQYLFEGEDRQNLLKRPEKLLRQDLSVPGWRISTSWEYPLGAEKLSVCLR